MPVSLLNGSAGAPEPSSPEAVQVNESLGSGGEDTAEPEEAAGEAEAPEPTMSQAMEQPEAAAAMPHPSESILQVGRSLPT